MSSHSESLRANVAIKLSLSFCPTFSFSLSGQPALRALPAHRTGSPPAVGAAYHPHRPSAHRHYGRNAHGILRILRKKYPLWQFFLAFLGFIFSQDTTFGQNNAHRANNLLIFYHHNDGAGVEFQLKVSAFGGISS